MAKISEILNLLLTSGIIGLLLFYQSKKRKQKAEADISEFDAKVMQISHFSQQLKEAYIEIDNMQTIIDRQRENLIKMTKDISELRIKLIQEEERRLVAEYNKCTVKNCENRQPPKNENNG